MQGLNPSLVGTALSDDNNNTSARRNLNLASDGHLSPCISDLARLLTSDPFPNPVILIKYCWGLIESMWRPPEVQVYEAIIGVGILAHCYAEILYYLDQDAHVDPKSMIKIDESSGPNMCPHDSACPHKAGV